MSNSDLILLVTCTNENEYTTLKWCKFHMVIVLVHQAKTQYFFNETLSISKSGW